MGLGKPVLPWLAKSGSKGPEEVAATNLAKRIPALSCHCHLTYLLDNGGGGRRDLTIPSPLPSLPLVQVGQAWKNLPPLPSLPLTRERKFC